MNNIKYEVGDLIYVEESIYTYKIIKIEDDKYLLEYKNINGEISTVWSDGSDFEGFVEGTEKYLKSEIAELLKIYSYEDVVDAMNEILDNCL